MQTTPIYPNGWGNTIAAKDLECVDISGVYANIGEDATHPNRPVRFSFLLYKNKTIVSHVQITQPNKTSLDIALWDGKRLVDKKHYVKGKDFACTNSEIDFTGKTELIGENVLGAMQSKHSLRITDEGSLVVKQSSEGVGLAFGIVPMGGSDIQWYRFKPMAQNVDGDK